MKRPTDELTKPVLAHTPNNYLCLFISWKKTQEGIAEETMQRPEEEGILKCTIVVFILWQ